MRLYFPVLLCALCLSSLAANSIPREEYLDRRAEARKNLKGVVVLFGETSETLRSGFIQEPNFYYLTGWREPGAILLLAPDDASSPAEILFLPARNPEQEKYTGRKLAPEDKDTRDRTGFDHVMPASAFESQLENVLERSSRLFSLTKRPEADKLKTLAPLREIQDAAPTLLRQRLKKSAREIEMIQRAADATVEAHRAAWKRIAPGVFEYQVAAAMSSVYFDQGCERHAYAPIVGSGPNGTVLHYWRNKRRMDRGDLVVMDVGAECSAYAADITRTAPVGGKFTARQREVYDVVLGAQKAAIAAVKPGVIMGAEKSAPNSLYKIAYDYIDSHGKDRQGQPLGKYFTHKLGHPVGLEVHDAMAPGWESQPLESGTVITIEPGIYLPEEGFGVRIEDMVLVTETGARVLSAALPREPADIERAMAK